MVHNHPLSTRFLNKVLENSYITMKTELSSAGVEEALAGEMRRQLQELHIQGAAVALIRERKVVLRLACGLRNAGTGEALTPHHVFEAYSLTKPLVAYRALQLCQAGVLELDRPLADYLSTPYIADDGRAQLITARTVLAHTSGLPDDETERRITFTPGAQWSYSTQGYGLLQQVIDRVTAEPFAAQMQRQILDPLAMTASSFVWQARCAAVMAQGHNAQGIPQSDRQIHVADADSLLTTAADYATFVTACVWPAGSPSSQQLARLMLRPQVTVADKLSWGLGWGIEAAHDGPFLWHIGGGRGAPFQNFVFVSAAQGSGLVLLTNSANGGALFEPVVRWLTGRNFALFQFVQDYFYR